MASAVTIHVSVITPERKVLETEATSVIFPQHDGLVGVLKGRAPLVCELGIGVLRIDTAGMGPKEFYIDGGFAQVRSNNVSILTQKAVPAEEITRAAADKAFAEASALPMKTDQQFAEHQAAVERARTQQKLAAK